MTIASLFNGIGYLGTLAISLSFIVALTGLAQRRPGLFLWLNFIGGCALCFPTIIAGTLVTHVLNVFWIIIAASGLAGLYSNDRFCLSFRCLAAIALAAGVIVLLLGVPPLLDQTLRGMTPSVMGMVAMLCFMAGYFSISTQALGSRSLYAYLGLSMSGNIIYLPLLLIDENWPMVALQLTCFFAGLAKLSFLAWIKARHNVMTHSETV